ncbi:MAG: CCA tRNA nucleotidyltransferase [Pseudobdellovibrionaceae bacterium]
MTHAQLQADYLSAIKLRILDHPQWPMVFKISQIFKKNGFECCLVGGSVRDYLMGLTPKDLDLVTDAKPEDITPLFDKVLEMGFRFGVSQIVFDGEIVDVATFRREDIYLDGRHPEKIIYARMEEDYSRRDFTVNSLYFDLLKGQLHDFCGGISDIQTKTLKAVGNPQQRFLEDHLRILRGIRFAAKFDLQIEPNTCDALRACKDLVLKLSKHRITEELKKGFYLSERIVYLKQLKAFGLWDLLFPGIDLKLDFVDPAVFSKLKLISWSTFLASLFICFPKMAEKAVSRSQKKAELESFFEHLLLLKQEKKEILVICQNYPMDIQRQSEFIFSEFLKKLQL